MEAPPFGAAVSPRAKGTWRGAQTLTGPWPCLEAIIAQTSCHLLQGFRDMALELPWDALTPTPPGLWMETTRWSWGEQ